MENTTEHQFPNLNIKGSSKAILVTGGAGYVGSGLLRELLVNGYPVTCVDNLMFGGESL